MILLVHVYSVKISGINLSIFCRKLFVVFPVHLANFLYILILQ